jgi:photosystem II stability/assembly factor-like uncharacterized protein
LRTIIDTFLIALIATAFEFVKMKVPVFYLFRFLTFSVLLGLLSACNKTDNPITNNWTTVFQNNDLYLYSVKFLDNNTGFVMADIDSVHGADGWKIVLASSDGGVSWDKVTCTTLDTTDSFPLYDIVFLYPVSKNVLLTTGYNVHKSVDRGRTWTNVSPGWAGSSIEDLYVLDSLTWLVAKGRWILRTDNAGQTWETVFQTDFTGVLQHFSFPSADTGYITDGAVDPDHYLSAGLILKTVDRGKHWKVLTPDPWMTNGGMLPYVVALQFISSLDGYMTTYEDSKLYKTSDGGDHWSLATDRVITNGLQYFINGNTGYSSDGMAVVVTNDGGKNWSVDSYLSVPGSEILTWNFLPSGRGYALTRDHRIIRNNR